MGPPRRAQFYYDLRAGELYAAGIRSGTRGHKARGYELARRRGLYARVFRFEKTAAEEMLMKRFHPIARYSLVLLVLFATTVSLVQSQNANRPNRPRRIAVFGSSVANG